MHLCCGFMKCTLCVSDSSPALGAQPFAHDHFGLVVELLLFGDMAMVFIGFWCAYCVVADVHSVNGSICIISLCAIMHLLIMWMCTRCGFRFSAGLPHALDALCNFYFSGEIIG